MPKLKIQYLFLFGAIIGLAPAAHAQQLESLADASWQAHGRLGAGLSAYSRGDGGADRTSPFAYVLSGSLNLSYGDFAIPVSVSYRDQQGSLSNPFQYFGISPSYRWATLHLGHRSLPMGKYLLAGQTFLGVGLELNPGKFRFAALRGRLRTPLLQVDSLVRGAELFEPYHRNLTAVRVGVGTDAHFFDLNVTRIEDRRREDADLPSDAPVPPPADNLGLGTAFAFRIAERVSVRGETALSLVTNDVERDTLAGDSAADRALVDALGRLVIVNETSGAFLAHDYYLAYASPGFGASLDFERVDPSFRSLGTPYLTNDVQRLSARINFGMFGQRVRVETQLGRQRNNLSGLLPTTRRRTIGSVSLSAKLSDEFSVRGRYYNFSTELQDGLLVVEDTLRRGQQTATYSLAPRYRKRLEDGTLNVALSADYRELAFNGTDGQRRGNDQYSVRLSGGRSWRANDLSLTGTLGFRQNLSETSPRTQFQTGIRASAGWLDQALTTGANVDYTVRRVAQTADGGVLSLGLNVSYRIGEKSTVGLRVNQITASSPVAARRLREVRGHLNWGFTF